MTTEPRARVAAGHPPVPNAGSGVVGAGLPRAGELYVAAVGLALVWPLLALLALLIWLESPGSPIFRQTRIGRYGRPFTLYKFRTMRRDAPPTAMPAGGLEHFVFSPPGPDTRRTRIGAVLRATSIDESLQLLNVLRGEMALVGPRPELPELVARYPAAWRRRHTVRPGLTGLAQINGRSDLTYARAIAYDLAYVRSRSAGLDVRILARTPLTVLRREGAR